MKTMKKVLSSVLLVCMLLSMCAVGAYAAEPDTGTSFIAGGTDQTDGDTTGGAIGETSQWPEGQNPNDTNQGGQNQNDTQNPGETGNEAGETEKEKNEVKFVGGDGNVSMKEGETRTLTVAYKPVGSGIEVIFDGGDGIIEVGETEYIASTEEGYGMARVQIRAIGIGSANIDCTLRKVEPAVDSGINAVDENGSDLTDGTEQTQEPKVEVLDTKTTTVTSDIGITLTTGGSYTEGKMYRNMPIQLDLNVTAAGFDKGKATFSSSDPSVATVDENGLVTGVSLGKTNITAAVKNDDGTHEISAIYKVEVINDLISVTGVTLNYTEESIKPKGTLQLIATVQPGDAANRGVKWTSSDTNVATVDGNGLVTCTETATAGSKATITVTTDDGGKTATCDVTVTTDTILVAGIQIIDENKVPVTTVDMTPGTNKEFAAVVTPDNADNKDIKWTSSNEKVFTVDDTGKVTAAVAVGSAILTATAKDTSAVTATCTINVKGTFTVSPEQENIIPGGTVELKAMFDGKEDNSNIEWASGDTSIATVDGNGKVTGVAAGTVTITAHEKSGLYADVTVSITVATVGTNIIMLTADKNPITQRGGATTIRARIFTVKEDGKYQELTGAVVDSITAQAIDSAAKSGTYYCNYSGNNTAEFRGGFNGKYRITAKYGTAVGTCDISVNYSPAITSGNNSVYNGKNELRFIVNDSIYNFSGNVWVDGMQLTNGVHYYSVSTSDGQIGIALNPAFLNYINRSAYHTITIGDNYGNASGYFRTWGTTSTIPGVKTGDDSNLALWLVLCLASAGCAAAVIVSAKKRKNKK